MTFCDLAFIRKITPLSKTNVRSEHGNVFFALFGAVAVVGVIGAASMSIMRGPLTTMVEVNKRTQAESQMQIAAKMAVIEAIDEPVLPLAPATAVSDCDGDNAIEPIPPRSPGATAAPANGGFIPHSFGVAKTDPWGTEYGYCAWDSGTGRGQAGCTVDTDQVALINGDGADTDYTVIAFISAGPDRVFNTTCNDFATADDDSSGDIDGGERLASKIPGSDDIVIETSYGEAQTVAGGLWKIKATDATKAEIGKDLEVAGGATFTGVAATSMLDLQGLAGSLRLPDQTLTDGATYCNLANEGILRRRTDNPSGIPTVEICYDADPTPAEDWDWANVAAGASDLTKISDDDTAAPSPTMVEVDDATGEITFDISGTEEMSITATDLDAGSLNIVTTGTLGAANTSLTGTLDVDGNVVLGDDAADTVTVTGLLGAAENVDFDKDLDVQGNVLLGDAITDTVDIAGTLDVLGLTTLTDLDITGSFGLDNDAEIEWGDGTVNIVGNSASGTFTVTAGDITFDGDTRVTGSLVVGTPPVTVDDAVEVDGDVDVTGTIKGDSLIIGGSPVTVDDAVEIDGDVDVTGAVKADDYQYQGESFIPASCDADEKLDFEGGEWVCENYTDEDGSGGGGDRTLEQVLTSGNDADGLDALNFGTVAIGSDTVSNSVNANLLLDVEGDIGALLYCDEAGDNCFAATDIANLASGAVTEIDDLTDALKNTTDNNLFLGFQPGTLTNNVQNTSIGIAALDALDNSAAANAGDENTAVGFQTLTSNASGSGNTAVGKQAMTANVAGSGNTAIGRNSLFEGSNNEANTIIGSGAAAGDYSTPAGYILRNTAVGYGAGGAFNAGATSGLGPDNNVLLGYRAGAAITTGDNNIIIGYDISSSSATASNELNIGNTILGNLTNNAISVGAANAGAIHTSAKFQIDSTTRGFLPPRNADPAANIATPATGLMAFDTGDNELQFYNGTTWVSVGGAGSIADDSLDWNKFIDAMTLDATTTINMDANNADFNFDSNTFFIDSSTNRVGIGNAAPVTALDVTGTISVSDRVAIAPQAVTTIISPAANIAPNSLDFDDFIDAMTMDATTTINMDGANADLNIDSNTLFIDSSANSMAVGAATVASTALLELASTTKGFLPPRMTTAQRTAITTPADGLTVYDTDLDSIYVYDGDGTNVWVAVAGGTASITADSLDWSHFSDAMTLDATTTINMDSNNADFNIDSNTLFIDSSANSMAIGAATVASTALLELSSTTKGLLPPRMTTAQRTAIASPADGLAVYDTDLDSLYMYDGDGTNVWVAVAGGAGSIADDALDWNKFIDAMTMDATTTINMDGANADLNIDSNTLFIDSSANSMAVGAATVASTALLELASTTKGLLPPRMTTAQRTAIASPADGLTVYDTTTDALYIYDGDGTNVWVAAGANGASMALDNLTDGLKNTTANNMFLGHEGGASIGADNIENVGVGIGALDSLTNTGSASDFFGDYNVALGYNALTAVTTGATNTAIGNRAGEALTTGGGNTAIGSSAMYNSSPTAFGNTAVGSAVLENVNGQDNVAMGVVTGIYLNWGSDNTFIGNAAARGNNTTYNYSGSENIVIGSDAALNLRNTNDRNTIIGTNSGAALNNGGSENILLGYNTDVSSGTAARQLNIGNLIYGALDNTATGGVNERQVGIGVTNAASINSTALLELSSTTRGFLPPRMTTAQRTAITTPADGLTVYDTDLDGIYIYDGDGTNVWVAAGANGASMALDNLTDGLKNTTANNMFLGHEGGASIGVNNLENMGIGIGALDSLTNTGSTLDYFGDYNVGIGLNALTAVTVGANNTAVGNRAGSSITNGGGNTAVGSFALLNTDPGVRDNVAVGTSAAENIMGNSNVMVGSTAGMLMTGGEKNIFIGTQAGYGSAGSSWDHYGDQNVIIGDLAGQNLANTNNRNTIIGASSGLGLNGGGSENILLGYNTNVTSGTASRQLNIGNMVFGVLDNTSTGGVDERQIGIGVTNAASISGTALLELASTTKGLLPPRMTTAQRTAIASPADGLTVYDTTADALYIYDGDGTNVWVAAGANSASIAIDNLSDGLKNTTANNMFLGHEGGASIGAVNLENMGVGIGALDSLTASGSASDFFGDYNVAVGLNALTAVTSGGSNTAVGNRAGQSLTIGGGNTVLGSSAMTGADPGVSDNVAIGTSAFENITSNKNIAIGSTAGMLMTDGTQNIFIGDQAGYGNWDHKGIQNVMIGDQAGLNLTTTNDRNTIVGARSAAALTGGSENILLGYNTNVTSGTASRQLNIGNMVFGVLDNTSTGGVDERQVGIGVTNAASISATALLELSSTTKGFLPPRMTTAQRTAITTPADGLAVYDTTADTLYIYDGDGTNVWVGVGGAIGSTTQVAYNNAGTMTGSANFTYNGTTLAVSHSAASATGAVSGSTSSTTAGAYGVSGVSSGTSGANFGVYGSNASATGFAVNGVNTATAGTAVKGEANTGAATGVLGVTSSTTAAASAVKGTATGATGASYGVYGSSASATGYGGYFTNSNGGVSLYVNGDMQFVGSITDVSDRRLKTDIHKLETDEIIEKLSRIDTYSFRMKDDPKGDVEFGVMAQELEVLFPELVRTANDEMGTKSVNYMGLIAPMIEVSKSLKSENDRLKAELAEVKAQQAQVLAAIDTLKMDVKGLKAYTGLDVKQANSLTLLVLVMMMGGVGLMLVIRRRRTGSN